MIARAGKMRGAIFLGVLALTVAVSTGLGPKAECEDTAEFVIPNFKVPIEYMSVTLSDLASTVFRPTGTKRWSTATILG